MRDIHHLPPKKGQVKIDQNSHIIKIAFSRAYSINMKASYLLNAFSLQMIDTTTECVVSFREVKELPKKGLVSAIGHADTAAVLGVECNRVNVTLKPGDTAYVAQLIGGRLPEGSTKLPEGFSFKFVEVFIHTSQTLVNNYF